MKMSLKVKPLAALKKQFLPLQQEFEKVAIDGAEVDELLVGEVGVKDYGDKDNEDLADRFGAKKDDFPGNQSGGSQLFYSFSAKATDMMRVNETVFAVVLGCSSTSS